MNPVIKRVKQMVRPYLQQVSEQALWQLYAMAQDGRVEFMDACKCVRGIVGGGTRKGYLIECSPEAKHAETGLLLLGSDYNGVILNGASRDPIRNRRLLPMVRAEIRRRARIHALIETAKLQFEAVLAKGIRL